MRMFRNNSMGPRDGGEIRSTFSIVLFRNLLVCVVDSLGGELCWAAGLSLISDFPKKPHWPVKTHLFLNAGRLDNINRGELIPVAIFLHCHSSYRSLAFSAKSLAVNVQESISRPSISAGLGITYRFDPLRVEVNFGVPLVASKSDGHRRGFEVGIGVNFL